MKDDTFLMWNDNATLNFDPDIDDLRDKLIREGVLVPVGPDRVHRVLWCFTHNRIPEDGIDLCGDEWRDIGPCDFGKALIVRARIRRRR